VKGIVTDWTSSWRATIAPAAAKPNAYSENPSTNQTMIMGRRVGSSAGTAWLLTRAFAINAAPTVIVI